MTDTQLNGKRILVLGGTVRESIDGVRYYANHARPHTHGLQAARLLAQSGAEVTLLGAIAAPSLPGVHIPAVHIVSTLDLAQAARGEASRSVYDAVLQLANIPAITAAHPAAQKLKLKPDAAQPAQLKVVGNLCLREALSPLPMAGYDRQGTWFSSLDSTLAKALEAIARRAAELPAPAAHFPTLFTSEQTLRGLKIVLTSGPTVEPLSTQGDVITNMSSGKQGHALALALAQMGAEVTLVCGPAAQPPPEHPAISVQHAATAREMLAAVLAALPADVYIGVAAVADFSLPPPLPTFLLREGEPYTLHLAQNPDILHTVGHHPTLRPSLVIGFAAETHDVLAYARAKLARKGADAICANEVGGALATPGSDDNRIWWVSAHGAEAWERMDKLQAGQEIGRKIVDLLAHVP